MEKRDLRFPSNKENKDRVLETRKQNLLNLGFPQEYVDRLAEKDPNLSVANLAEEKVKDLTALGFKIFRIVPKYMNSIIYVCP